MYVASILMEYKAEIHVYDPKVTEQQIISDLEYLSVLNYHNLSNKQISNQIFVHKDPYIALENAHAIAVLTEWDEFNSFDWQRIYKAAMKLAFVFDGRNILNAKELKSYGFKIYQIGK